MLSWLFIGLLANTLRVALFDSNDGSCGYQSCPKPIPDMLNVHIISHTHDDVGWLKTVDQYFYGSKTYIQRAGVQYILDSVIGELQRDPNRRFIYVETAFFWQWWKNQSQTTKATVNDLVQSGRLEFIGGGWSMNDEAAAHYNAIIDQMTLGLRKLRSIFGACGVPRVAWQIDPFGHSREQASLFAQMGFDGLFLGRIDYQDKNQRLSTKSMEMIWNASSSLGADAHLFTGVLYNTYSPPDGFCFDLLCNDLPIIDDDESPDYNVDARVEDFLAGVERHSKYYATNNIAITMGNDFNYQDAGAWFINLDKLIKYTNALQKKGSKVNLFYSTPSCYLKALHDSKISWPTKSDDFFPYASDPHSYWTGYFTSRPALKGYVRKSNNFLQTCKQLDTLSFFADKIGSRIQKIDYLKRSMGIAQHHDAVSGTAKQHVTDDYVYRLYKGEALCADVIANAYKSLLPLGQDSPPDQIFCPQLNISQCIVTESENSFTVNVYNPAPHPVSTAVRFPTTQIPAAVYGPDGESIIFQIVPLTKAIIDFPDRRSLSTWEVVFLAELPGLSFQTYFVYKNKPAQSSHLRKRRYLENDLKHSQSDLVIANDKVQVVVDEYSGLLKEIVNLKENVSLPVKQTFKWYRGMDGFNMIAEERASGAYIFRPNGSYPIPVSYSAKARIVKGPVVQEIHQRFSDWVSQVIRIYNNSEHVEFDWIIGPIPIEDLVGKEIITRFETKLATGGKFYTDANGREILERVRNSRPTWKLNLSEPIAGNYYPVNSRLFIRDPQQDIQLTLLTDRSVGGTSMDDGSAELMLHRRLLYDDAFGVGEPLNELGVDGKGLIVRGKTVVHVNRISNAARAHRETAIHLLLEPSLTFNLLDDPVNEWQKKYRTKYSGLNFPLPLNVHLLTLERMSGQMGILRLENMYEVEEDSQMSKPVTVDVEKLFNGITILTMNETTLAANQLLSDRKPLKWVSDTNNIHEISLPSNTAHSKRSSATGKFQVTLNPMEIRTFIVSF